MSYTVRSPHVGQLCPVEDLYLTGLWLFIGAMITDEDQHLQFVCEVIKQYLMNFEVKHLTS